MAGSITHGYSWRDHLPCFPTGDGSTATLGLLLPWLLFWLGSPAGPRQR